MQAKQLTIRNVSPELSKKLKKLAQVRGESVNSTVLYILRQALDANEKRQRLARYATWTEREFEEFESALQAQRTIDDALWK